MGLRSLGQVSTFDELARIYVAYEEIKDMRGWKDFQCRLYTMREQIKGELLLGSVDKWGNSHDNEKRAVLVFMDRILDFAPALEAQYTDLKRRKDEMEQRSRDRFDLHQGEFAQPGRLDF